MTETPKLIATIITKADDFGILLPDVTGVADGVQAVQVDVSEAGLDVEHHLVVNAHYPKMEFSFCEQLGTQLRNHFGEIIVSFTMNNEAGRAIVFVPSIQGNHYSLPSVAAAVAVMKRSWGWDESEWIEVKDEATKEHIKVYPAYDGEKWVIETYP